MTLFCLNYGKLCLTVCAVNAAFSFSVFNH
nr:MAG TPA: hypothetical protein [Caudoviricetes sp.]